MRSKRLLAILLAFCLVFSGIAPAASAVEAPADSVLNAEQETNEVVETTKSESSANENGLIASGEDAQAAGVNTMRDSLISKVEDQNIADSEGVWDVTPAEDPDIDLLTSEVPACIEELREAAELYSASDVVTAFVVMEDAPLADSYNNRRLVSASMEKALIEKQDAVISAIEKTVLKGEKLDVRYQFTYLTNSFSIETNFENLEKIARISGVKSVFIMPVYTPCTTSNPNTAASGAMTGVHAVWENLGYTGEGMKIAVIDTGLDLDHPSFSALNSEMVTSNDNYMSVEDVAAVLENLNAYKYRSSITAEDLYRSTKVPYAFNYCDANLTADHSADYAGDHGTHVSGIAAANATEGTTVVGMAPDAQIIVMKVFGANGGAYADDIVAGLEDAMTLGCDVVNASLGSPAGFASSDTELDLIYERLANQNIVATFSAGNEGTSSYSNMWGTDLNRTQNPDNATVGSPATWANTLAIASAENSEVMTPYFALADGTKVFFNQTYEYMMGEVAGMETLINQELEFVVIDGLGNEEDFYDAEGNSLVEGKVAVVSRGEINFGMKIYNAELAGAVCCIIANNNSADDIFNFYMNTSLEDAEGNTFYPSIPACLISLDDGMVMADAEIKTMVVSETMAARVCEGGQMSSFSSWGVSPDLQLVPDITGIGGNVYSCYDGGSYGLMSGTSMSAPQVAGVSALVMQYLYSKYPDAANDGSIRDLTEAILMSTANPIVSSDSGVEASPRQQGAGLVNAAAAVKTKAYLTVNGDRPKAELGDSKSGSFTFTFEIHNISNETETYTLSSSLLTEDIVDYGIGEYFMAGYDVALTGDVTFSADSVTVAAGESATVTVTISLSDEDKVMFARYWENGGYVEGFVYLDNADEYGVDLSLPFLGFYGDWTQAPVFDTAYWYDNSFWGLNPADGWPEGDEYYNVIWTSLPNTDWVLGFNPYAGAYADNNGNVAYDPANNSVSPNGDGVVDGIDEIYLSLLRNAKALTFTYTVDGEIVHQETVTNNSKTMYLSSYGQVIPWLYSWYGDRMFDFSTLENNTKVTLTIEAKVDYGMGGNNVIEIPITVDTEVPELLEAYQVTEADGSHSLVVITSDNVNVAAMYLMNRSGSRVYAEDYALDAREDGTYMASFNVDELGTELMVALCDYAGNEGYYNITYTEAGDNVPDMTPYEDQLFAYRVYDNYIYSDHMYGWVSMDKPAEGENANLSVWTDDYLEYAAINAAEYVDGKIFAVDAVYNLVVMEPGLFDRRTVTNLGVNVLDMTFDDSTDTMYVLSKDGSYTTLYSMDLLTGELTRLKYYGYYYYEPWAIADDDNGTLYAIVPNSSYIYTLDVAGGTYEQTPVTDENGDEIVFTDSNGNALSPSVNSQSITYLDGNLYWAYFKNSYYSPAAELITINTTDWTSYASPYAAVGYDADYNLVEYYPATELVGLLTLTETDYQIPESTEATSISLDAEQIIMAVGAANRLSAAWLPWNYVLDESQLVWTSDDESVATVADGVVTGVGEGITNVNVSYGDLTASCEIVVVDITGNFEAYNYYTADGYYGYMIDVDMETMDYTLVGDASPVDFVAGDYNGHDGYFYGYDMGGQLYRYDYATNEATALGASLGTYPVDMAYDYSTGMMYALVLDYNTYENTLYAVNMNNGKTMEVATGMGLLTLAISTDGVMYSTDASGYVNQVMIQDYSMYGMGNYMEAMPVLEDSFGDLYMLASMCWDHNNDVLLWNWCEGATIVWIDVEGGYYVDLGDPSESGILELVGMHVVPDEIPELPDVAVESVTAEDMLILTGYEKVPSVVVAPFNATCQDLVMTSSDSTIVEVTENGTLLGVSSGEATITATLEDEVSGETFEVTFNVTVMESADNLYAHLLTDVTTMNAQAWIQLYPGNPGQYDTLGYFDYTVFTEEHVDGKIYTYGYDAMDWTGNWQFFILDAETYQVETQIDMGEAFPYVYDMTYDYVTSTMYVLAGASEDNTDLYVADMETGKLVLLMEIEPLLMAIAAGPEGELYAIENSVATMDWETWQQVLGNAYLHVIDPLNGTMELVGDTGLKSNMISSMAYDFDTDALYWTPFAQDSSYISNLAIVNTETGAATSLGTIGIAGAQVGGLYFLCDEYPEADTSTLHNLMMSSSKATVITGETVELGTIMMPNIEDAELTWSSSDESIATVDADGVVTGVMQGSAVITATASYNGVTKSASCKVAVLDLDAAFLTYNETDGGWALINRNDYTVVTNLTEGEETGVLTIASVGDDVYGYDVNNQLFKLDTNTFERTNIGEGVGLEVAEDTQFVIKDMAYDAVNEQMLVLGDSLVWDDYWEEYSEVYNGCALYSVDLTTGALEQLYVFEDYSFVYAMSVGTAGEVYFYNTFDDGVDVLDLSTGTVNRVITLQSQSLYGDGYCDYAMYYDELTDTLYLLFTSNGNFYKMVTIDATLGTLIDNGYVGEVVQEGWSYMGDTFRGLTFATVEVEEPSDVEWAGSSLSLKGDISLNFYAILSEKLLNDPDAYIQLSVDDRVLTVPVSEGILDDSDGSYKFSISLNAKNMGDKVTAQFYNADGAVGTSTTMSVKDYADYVIANSSKETLVNLMKAMLNYGAAAQVEFDYDVENLVNADMSEADQTLPETVDVSAYAATLSGAEEGITVTNISLLLQSATKLRVYFKLADGKSINDYVFTVDGETVTPVASGDEYYIEKENVAAKDLDTMYAFQMGGLTLNLCGLSYVKQVQKYQPNDVDLMNLCKALYCYNVAANAYFG